MVSNEFEFQGILLVKEACFPLCTQQATLGLRLLS